jgi:hypothetical protein
VVIKLCLDVHARLLNVEQSHGAKRALALASTKPQR